MGRRRAFQAEGAAGVGPQRAVAGQWERGPRPGLRGCEGYWRPYPESNAKLLRGFGVEEVMRFAFLKDHFLCRVESGLGAIRGYCCERDREGSGQMRD